jgi:glycosyltransferase involved in cell wall biosynthesis
VKILPKTPLKISLIIAVHDQRAALEKILPALARQTRLPDEILVADDGSSDGTAELLAAWKPKFAIRLEHFWQPHEGFRKNRILNQAAAAASGEYLIFTDGDCVPHFQFIVDHAALAEKGYWVQGRRCFVREPYVREFMLGQTPLWRWRLQGRIARVTKSFRLPCPVVFRDRGQRGIIGCNMAYWREDFLAVNGFNEDYQGRGMGADSDLASRVYNLGRKRKFIYGRALVFHLDHPIAPRPHYAANRARLDEVLRSGTIRCENGLNLHL